MLLLTLGFDRKKKKKEKNLNQYTDALSNGYRLTITKICTQRISTPSISTTSLKRR